MRPGGLCSPSHQDATSTHRVAASFTTARHLTPSDHTGNAASSRLEDEKDEDGGGRVSMSEVEGEDEDCSAACNGSILINGALQQDRSSFLPSFISQDSSQGTREMMAFPEKRPLHTPVAVDTSPEASGDNITKNVTQESPSDQSSAWHSNISEATSRPVGGQGFPLPWKAAVVDGTNKTVPSCLSGAGPSSQVAGSGLRLGGSHGISRKPGCSSNPRVRKKVSLEDLVMKLHEKSGVNPMDRSCLPWSNKSFCDFGKRVKSDSDPSVAGGKDNEKADGKESPVRVVESDPSSTQLNPGEMEQTKNDNIKVNEDSKIISNRNLDVMRDNSVTGTKESERLCENTSDVNSSEIRDSKLSDVTSCLSEKGEVENKDLIIAENVREPEQVGDHRTGEGPIEKGSAVEVPGEITHTEVGSAQPVQESDEVDSCNGTNVAAAVCKTSERQLMNVEEVNKTKDRKRGLGEAAGRSGSIPSYIAKYLEPISDDESSILCGSSGLPSTLASCSNSNTPMFSDTPSDTSCGTLVKISDAVAAILSDISDDSLPESPTVSDNGPKASDPNLFTIFGGGSSDISPNKMAVQTLSGISCRDNFLGDSPGSLPKIFPGHGEETKSSKCICDRNSEQKNNVCFHCDMVSGVHRAHLVPMQCKDSTQSSGDSESGVHVTPECDEDSSQHMLSHCKCLSQESVLDRQSCSCEDVLKKTRVLAFDSDAIKDKTQYRYCEQEAQMKRESSEIQTVCIVSQDLSSQTESCNNFNAIIDEDKSFPQSSLSDTEKLEQIHISPRNVVVESNSRQNSSKTSLGHSLVRADEVLEFTHFDDTAKRPDRVSGKDGFFECKAELAQDESWPGSSRLQSECRSSTTCTDIATEVAADKENSFGENRDVGDHCHDSHETNESKPESYKANSSKLPLVRQLCSKASTTLEHTHSYQSLQLEQKTLPAFVEDKSSCPVASECQSNVVIDSVGSMSSPSTDIGNDFVAASESTSTKDKISLENKFPSLEVPNTQKNREVGFYTSHCKEGQENVSLDQDCGKAAIPDTLSVISSAADQDNFSPSISSSTENALEQSLEVAKLSATKQTQQVLCRKALEVPHSPCQLSDYSESDQIDAEGCRISRMIKYSKQLVVSDIVKDSSCHSSCESELSLQGFSTSEHKVPLLQESVSSKGSDSSILKHTYVNKVDSASSQLEIFSPRNLRSSLLKEVSYSEDQETFIDERDCMKRILCADPADIHDNRAETLEGEKNVQELDCELLTQGTSDCTETAVDASLNLQHGTDNFSKSSEFLQEEGPADCVEVDCTEVECLSQERNFLPSMKKESHELSQGMQFDYQESSPTSPLSVSTNENFSSEMNLEIKKCSIEEQLQQEKKTCEEVIEDNSISKEVTTGVRGEIILGNNSVNMPKESPAEVTLEDTSCENKEELKQQSLPVDEDAKSAGNSSLEERSYVEKQTCRMFSEYGENKPIHENSFQNGTISHLYTEACSVSEQSCMYDAHQGSSDDRVKEFSTGEDIQPKEQVCARLSVSGISTNTQSFIESVQGDTSAEALAQGVDKQEQSRKPGSPSEFLDQSVGLGRSVCKFSGETESMNVLSDKPIYSHESENLVQGSMAAKAVDTGLINEDSESGTPVLLYNVLKDASQEGCVLQGTAKYGTTSRLEGEDGVLEGQISEVYSAEDPVHKIKLLEGPEFKHRMSEGSAGVSQELAQEYSVLEGTSKGDVLEVPVLESGVWERPVPKDSMTQGQASDVSNESPVLRDISERPVCETRDPEGLACESICPETSVLEGHISQELTQCLSEEPPDEDVVSGENVVQECLHEDLGNNNEDSKVLECESGSSEEAEPMINVVQRSSEASTIELPLQDNGVQGAYGIELTSKFTTQRNSTSEKLKNFTGIFTYAQHSTDTELSHCSSSEEMHANLIPEEPAVEEFASEMACESTESESASQKYVSDVQSQKNVEAESDEHTHEETFSQNQNYHSHEQVCSGEEEQVERNIAKENDQSQIDTSISARTQDSLTEDLGETWQESRQEQFPLYEQQNHIHGSISRETFLANAVERVQNVHFEDSSEKPLSHCSVDKFQQTETGSSVHEQLEDSSDDVHSTSTSIHETLLEKTAVINMSEGSDLENVVADVHSFADRTTEKSKCEEPLLVSELEGFSMNTSKELEHANIPQCKENLHIAYENTGEDCVLNEPSYNDDLSNKSLPSTTTHSEPVDAAAHESVHGTVSREHGHDTLVEESIQNIISEDLIYDRVSEKPIISKNPETPDDLIMGEPIDSDVEGSDCKFIQAHHLDENEPDHVQESSGDEHNVRNVSTRSSSENLTEESLFLHTSRLPEPVHQIHSEEPFPSVASPELTQENIQRDMCPEESVSQSSSEELNTQGEPVSEGEQDIHAQVLVVQEPDQAVAPDESVKDNLIETPLPCTKIEDTFTSISTNKPHPCKSVCVEIKQGDGLEKTPQDSVVEEFVKERPLHDITGECVQAKSIGGSILEGQEHDIIANELKLWNNSEPLEEGSSEELCPGTGLGESVQDERLEEQLQDVRESVQGAAQVSGLKEPLQVISKRVSEQELETEELLHNVRSNEFAQEVKPGEPVQKVGSELVHGIGVRKPVQGLNIREIQEEVTQSELMQELANSESQQEIAQDEQMLQDAQLDSAEEIAYREPLKEITLVESLQQIAQDEQVQEEAHIDSKEAVAQVEPLNEITLVESFQKISRDGPMQEVTYDPAQGENVLVFPKRQPVPQLQHDESVLQVLQDEPLYHMSQSDPVPQVAQGEPMRNVALSEAETPIALGKPMDQVTRDEPVSLVVQSDSVLQVTQSDLVLQVAHREPMSQVAQSKPVPQVALSEPVPQVAQNEPVLQDAQSDSVPQVAQSESMPQFVQNESIPQVEHDKPVQGIAQDEPALKVALDEATQDVQVELMLGVAQDVPQQVAQGEHVVEDAQYEPTVVLAQGVLVHEIAQDEPLQELAQDEPLQEVTHHESSVQVVQDEPNYEVVQSRPFIDVTHSEFALDVTQRDAIPDGALDESLVEAAQVQLMLEAPQVETASEVAQGDHMQEVVLDEPNLEVAQGEPAPEAASGDSTSQPGQDEPPLQATADESSLEPSHGEPPLEAASVESTLEPVQCGPAVEAAPGESTLEATQSEPALEHTQGEPAQEAQGEFTLRLSHGEPTLESTSGESALGPAHGEPTTEASLGESMLKLTQGKPTLEPAQDEPTQGAVQDKPQLQAVQDELTLEGTWDMPVLEVEQGEPVQEKRKLTLKVTQDEPPLEVPLYEPVSEVAQGEPKLEVAEDEPILESMQGGPLLETKPVQEVAQIEHLQEINGTQHDKLGEFAQDGSMLSHAQDDSAQSEPVQDIVQRREPFQEDKQLWDEPIQVAPQGEHIPQVTENEPTQERAHDEPTLEGVQDDYVQETAQDELVQEVGQNEVPLDEYRYIQEVVQDGPVQEFVHNVPTQELAPDVPTHEFAQNEQQLEFAHCESIQEEPTEEYVQDESMQKVVQDELVQVEAQSESAQGVKEGESMHKFTQDELEQADQANYIQKVPCNELLEDSHVETLQEDLQVQTLQEDSQTASPHEVAQDDSKWEVDLRASLQESRQGEVVDMVASSKSYSIGIRSEVIHNAGPGESVQEVTSGEPLLEVKSGEPVQEFEAREPTQEAGSGEQMFGSREYEGLELEHTQESGSVHEIGSEELSCEDVEEGSLNEASSELVPQAVAEKLASTGTPEKSCMESVSEEHRQLVVLQECDQEVGLQKLEQIEVLQRPDHVVGLQEPEQGDGSQEHKLLGSQEPEQVDESGDSMQMVVMEQYVQEPESEETIQDLEHKVVQEQVMQEINKSPAQEVSAGESVQEVLQEAYVHELQTLPVQIDVQAVVSKELEHKTLLNPVQEVVHGELLYGNVLGGALLKTVPEQCMQNLIQKGPLNKELTSKMFGNTEEKSMHECILKDPVRMCAMDEPVHENSFKTTIVSCSGSEAMLGNIFREPALENIQEEYQYIQERRHEESVKFSQDDLWQGNREPEYERMSNLPLQNISEEPSQKLVSALVQKNMVKHVQENLAEPVQENFAKSVLENVTEPLQENMMEHVQEHMAETMQKNVAELVQENVAEPLQENMAEPLQENMAEPVQENMVEFVQENMAEPLQESVAEPVQENMAEPVQEHKAEPLQENMTEPVQENMEEPLQESMAEPLQEHTAEPVQENVAELVQENMAEPLLENMAEPVPENMVEPVQENMAEPVQENMAEPVQENMAEPVQENMTEPVQENMTEPVQENMTEPVQENMAEPLQENMAEPVQENMAEPVQENMAEPVEEHTVEQLQENVAELVQENMTEPMQRNMIEPLQGNMAESMEENMTEPVQENVSEAVQENMAEPVQESIANPRQVMVEPELEGMVEPVREVIAEPVHEVMAESVQEVLAEPVQEVMAESVQKVMAEPVQEMLAEFVQETTVEPVLETMAEPVQDTMAEPVQDTMAEPVQIMEGPVQEFMEDSVQTSALEELEEGTALHISENDVIKKPVQGNVQDNFFQVDLSEEPVQRNMLEEIENGKGRYMPNDTLEEQKLQKGNEAEAMQEHTSIPEESDMENTSVEYKESISLDSPVQVTKSEGLLLESSPEGYRQNVAPEEHMKENTQEEMQMAGVSERYLQNVAAEELRLEETQEHLLENMNEVPGSENAPEEFLQRSTEGPILESTSKESALVITPEKRVQGNISEEFEQENTEEDSEQGSTLERIVPRSAQEVEEESVLEESEQQNPEEKQVHIKEPEGLKQESTVEEPMQENMSEIYAHENHPESVKVSHLYEHVQESISEVVQDSTAEKLLQEATHKESVLENTSEELQQERVVENVQDTAKESVLENIFEPTVHEAEHCSVRGEKSDNQMQEGILEESEHHCVQEQLVHHRATEKYIEDGTPERYLPGIAPEKLMHSCHEKESLISLRELESERTLYASMEGLVQENVDREPVLEYRENDFMEDLTPDEPVQEFITAILQENTPEELRTKNSEAKLALERMSDESLHGQTIDTWFEEPVYEVLKKPVQGIPSEEVSEKTVYEKSGIKDTPEEYFQGDTQEYVEQDVPLLEYGNASAFLHGSVSEGSLEKNSTVLIHEDASEKTIPDVLSGEQFQDKESDDPLEGTQKLMSDCVWSKAPEENISHEPVLGSVSGEPSRGNVLEHISENVPVAVDQTQESIGMKHALQHLQVEQTKNDILSGNGSCLLQEGSVTGECSTCPSNVQNRALVENEMLVVSKCNLSQGIDSILVNEQAMCGETGKCSPTDERQELLLLGNGVSEDFELNDSGAMDNSSVFSGEGFDVCLEESADCKAEIQDSFELPALSSENDFINSDLKNILEQDCVSQQTMKTSEEDTNCQGVLSERTGEDGANRVLSESGEMLQYLHSDNNPNIPSDEIYCNICESTVETSIDNHLAEFHICVSFIPAEKTEAYKHFLKERVMEVEILFKKENYKSESYVCATCLASFSNVQAVLTHSNLHDHIYLVKSSGVRCPCMKKVYASSLCRWKAVLQTTTFVCILCDYFFACENGLNSHIEVVHYLKEHCRICQASVPAHERLSHFKIHSENQKLTLEIASKDITPKSSNKYGLSRNIIDNQLNYLDGKDFRLNTSNKVEDPEGDRSYLQLPISNVPMEALVPDISRIEPEKDLKKYIKGKADIKVLVDEENADAIRNFDLPLQLQLQKNLGHQLRKGSRLCGTNTRTVKDNDMLSVLRLQMVRTRSSKPDLVNLKPSRVMRTEAQNIQGNRCTRSKRGQQLEPSDEKDDVPALTRTRSGMKPPCEDDDREEGKMEGRTDAEPGEIIVEGEWSSEHTYVCCACGEAYLDLGEMMDHKWEAHPSVWCAHTMIQGQAPVPLSFSLQYQPPVTRPVVVPLPSSNASGIINSKNGSEYTRRLTCSRCSSSFLKVEEFHLHLVECGGLASTSPSKKKSKRGFKFKRRKGQGVPVRQFGLSSHPGTPRKSKQGDGSGLNTPLLENAASVAGPAQGVKRRLELAIGSIDNMDLKNRLKAIISSSSSAAGFAHLSRKTIRMKLRRKTRDKTILRRSKRSERISEDAKKKVTDKDESERVVVTEEDKMKREVPNENGDGKAQASETLDKKTQKTKWKKKDLGQINDNELPVKTVETTNSSDMINESSQDKFLAKGQSSFKGANQSKKKVVKDTTSVKTKTVKAAGKGKVKKVEKSKKGEGKVKDLKKKVEKTLAQTVDNGNGAVKTQIKGKGLQGAKTVLKQSGVSIKPSKKIKDVSTIKNKLPTAKGCDSDIVKGGGNSQVKGKPKKNKAKKDIGSLAEGEVQIPVEGSKCVDKGPSKTKKKYIPKKTVKKAGEFVESENPPVGNHSALSVVEHAVEAGNSSVDSYIKQVNVKKALLKKVTANLAKKASMLNSAKGKKLKATVNTKDTKNSLPWDVTISKSGLGNMESKMEETAVSNSNEKSVQPKQNEKDGKSDLNKAQKTPKKVEREEAVTAKKREWLSSDELDDDSEPEVIRNYRMGRRHIGRAGLRRKRKRLNPRYTFRGLSSDSEKDSDQSEKMSDDSFGFQSLEYSCRPRKESKQVVNNDTQILNADNRLGGSDPSEIESKTSQAKFLPKVQGGLGMSKPTGNTTPVIGVSDGVVGDNVGSVVDDDDDDLPLSFIAMNIKKKPKSLCSHLKSNLKKEIGTAKTSDVRSVTTENTDSSSADFVGFMANVSILSQNDEVQSSLHTKSKGKQKGKNKAKAKAKVPKEKSLNLIKTKKSGLTTKKQKGSQQKGKSKSGKMSPSESPKRSKGLKIISVTAEINREDPRVSNLEPTKTAKQESKVEDKSHVDSMKQSLKRSLEAADLEVPSSLDRCSADAREAGGNSDSSINAAPQALIRAKRRRSSVEKIKDIPTRASLQNQSPVSAAVPGEDIEVVSAVEPSVVESLHPVPEEVPALVPSSKKKKNMNTSSCTSQGKATPVSKVASTKAKAKPKGVPKNVKKGNKVVDKKELKSAVTAQLVPKLVSEKAKPSKKKKKNTEVKSLAEDLIKCMDCGLRFDTHALLEEHQQEQDCVNIAFEMSLMEAEDHLFECPHCHLTFAYKGTQRKHTSSCRAVKYKRVPQRSDGKVGHVSKVAKGILLPGQQQEQISGPDYFPGHLPVEESCQVPNSNLGDSSSKKVKVSKKRKSNDVVEHVIETSKDSSSSTVLVGSERQLDESVRVKTLGSKKMKVSSRGGETLVSKSHTKGQSHKAKKVKSSNKDSRSKKSKFNGENDRPALTEELSSNMASSWEQWCLACNLELPDLLTATKHQLYHKFTSKCQQRPVLEVCVLLVHYGLSVEQIRQLITSAISYQGSTILDLSASDGIANSEELASSAKDSCLSQEVEGMQKSGSIAGPGATLRELLSSPVCVWVTSVMDTIAQKLTQRDTVCISGSRQEALKAVTTVEEVLKELLSLDIFVKKNNMLLSMRQTFEAGTEN